MKVDGSNLDLSVKIGEGIFRRLGAPRQSESQMLACAAALVAVEADSYFCMHRITRSAAI